MMERSVFNEVIDYKTQGKHTPFLHSFFLTLFSLGSPIEATESSQQRSTSQEDEEDEDLDHPGMNNYSDPKKISNF